MDVRKIFLFIIWILAVHSTYATVYVSDNFDSQSDWVGKASTCIDPPSPWDDYGYYCSPRIHIDSTDDAHGSGKCMWIDWGSGMDEVALMTNAPAGKNDFWVGYWFRHSSGWNSGGDSSYKWFYGPSTNSGDRIMINYNTYGHAFIPSDGTLVEGDVPFDPNDDSWHHVIMYWSHGTGNKDGQIRLWWDRQEVTWKERYTGVPYDNLNVDVGTGTTWTTFAAFGFQSRPAWTPGNKAYFDDVIIASTRAEVESFLGLAPSGQIILADHFDSQPDWDGSQNTNLLTGEDIGDWKGIDPTSSTSGILSSYRHGATGKGAKIQITGGGSCSGGSAQETKMWGVDYTDYTTSLIVGYWNKATDTTGGSINWGTCSELKYVRIYHGDDSAVVFKNDGGQFIYWNSNGVWPTGYNIPTDTGWHSYIFEFKPESSSSGSANDGAFRMWVDNVLEYEQTSINHNVASPHIVRFSGGSGYPAVIMGGNMGGGYDGENINWYFDDFIVATALSDVIDFLGVGTVECSDGSDNDGDNLTDYPNDLGCTDANDDDETNCGDSQCEGGETCNSCPGDCSSDIDGDTYDSVLCGGLDCDDSNSSINPNGTEVCGNGIDEDCVSGDLVCICGSADADGDNIVSVTELMNYIDIWKLGNITILELMQGIKEWKSGC